MGYFVDTTNSNAVLPSDKMEEAYQRLVDLNKRDDLKSGGAFGPEGRTDVWFSWMPADYPSRCSTVEEILNAVGYNTHMDTKGNLTVYSYSDKTGCEDVFIWAIADLFEEGSYLEWRGEEGEQYRWDFGGGKPMTTSSAVIQWVDNGEFKPFDYKSFVASLRRP